MRSPSDRHSPREARQLDFITQYTEDVEYLSGVDNVEADAISRSTILNLTEESFGLRTIAEHQRDIAEQDEIRLCRSLELRNYRIPGTSTTLLCDMSRGKLRPYVPTSMRRAVFKQFHSLSHPSIRSTARIIADRFVWPLMQKDIRQWSRDCIDCQRFKVHRHTKTTFDQFPVVDARFSHVHIDFVDPLPISRNFQYVLTCVDCLTR